jgi:hypothetical protein
VKTQADLGSPLVLSMVPLVHTDGPVERLSASPVLAINIVDFFSWRSDRVTTWLQKISSIVHGTRGGERRCGPQAGLRIEKQLVGRQGKRYQEEC